MLYGTTITPDIIKVELEKEADFGLVSIPLLVSAAMAAWSAHSAYSGVKNIAKGNYGEGAFDLVGAIPMLGPASKGVKSVGMLARVLARGGKVGKLGVRASNMARTAAQSSKYKDIVTKSLAGGYTRTQAQRFGRKALDVMAKAPAPAAPTSMFGRARGAVGNWGGRMSERMSKGYQRAGAGKPSQRMSKGMWAQSDLAKVRGSVAGQGASEAWGPVRKSLMSGSRFFNRAGNRLGNFDKNVIGGNAVGRQLQGAPGWILPSVLYPYVGDQEQPSTPTSFVRPAIGAGVALSNYKPKLFNKMPQGFNPGISPQ